MPYETTITFTLDTICPWTYLAKRRLRKALAQVQSSHPDAHFTLKILPYRLYPNLSSTGEDKYTWYRRSRYGDSEEKMNMYTTLMTAYGVAEGIKFKFGGTMSNTLPAHRVIWYFQEEKGCETAERIVAGLYRMYFEEERDPSSRETLLEALAGAGIEKKEAERVVDDEDEGLMDVKMLIQEQAGNGIDAVPYVVVEGKRRDFTLVGAKEVDEYVKILEQCIKESR